MREIEQSLEEFVTDPVPYVIDFKPPLDLRSIAMKHHVLPVVLDMGGCYAIKSNGTVVSFTWDRPDDIRQEVEPRIQRMVLFHASVKYVALGILAPSRPIHAVDCIACEGTGSLRTVSPDIAKTVVCSCGGLGWVLPNET